MASIIFLLDSIVLESIVEVAGRMRIVVGCMAHTCDPSTGWLRWQEDGKFKPSLGNVARPCLKKGAGNVAQ